MAHCIEYHSITNQVIWSDHLIITEKIDGANLAIGYVNNVLHIQSRRKVIDRNSTFNNLDKIIDPLIAFVEQMKKRLKCNFLVYGEIFKNGGFKRISYDDSEASDKAFKDKTVFFRAFDIYRVDEKVFSKYSDAIKLFELIGLPYVPILDIKYETINDLYDKVETYKSAYSHEPVEGFVLKKDEEESRKFRTIFKVKRMKFNESGGLAYKYRAKNYVNMNRLISVYSKGYEDPEEVEKEMVEDALRDIMTIYNEEVRTKVDKLLFLHRDLDGLKDLSINDHEEGSSEEKKSRIEKYVNSTRFQAAHSEKRGDFEAIRKKLIEDAVREINSVYRSELESEVKILMEKYNRKQSKKC